MSDEEPGGRVPVADDHGAALGPTRDELPQEGDHAGLVPGVLVDDIDVGRQGDRLDRAGRQEGHPLPGGVVKLAGQRVASDVSADHHGKQIGARGSARGRDHVFS